MKREKNQPCSKRCLCAARTSAHATQLPPCDLVLPKLFFERISRIDRVLQMLLLQISFMTDAIARPDPGHVICFDASPHRWHFVHNYNLDVGCFGEVHQPARLGGRTYCRNNNRSDHRHKGSNIHIREPEVDCCASLECCNDSWFDCYSRRSQLWCSGPIANSAAVLDNGLSHVSMDISDIFAVRHRTWCAQHARSWHAIGHVCNSSVDRWNHNSQVHIRFASCVVWTHSQLSWVRGELHYCEWDQLFNIQSDTDIDPCQHGRMLVHILAVINLLLLCTFARTYTYSCKHTCAQARMSVHVCKYVHTCVHTRTRTDICPFACLSTYPPTCLDNCLPACLHAHLPACAHM